MILANRTSGTANRATVLLTRAASSSTATDFHQQHNFIKRDDAPQRAQQTADYHTTHTQNAKRQRSVTPEEAVNEVAMEMEQSAETSRLLGMFTPDHSAHASWTSSSGETQTGGWYKSRYGTLCGESRELNEVADDQYMSKVMTEFYFIILFART